MRDRGLPSSANEGTSSSSNFERCIRNDLRQAGGSALQEQEGDVSEVNGYRLDIRRGVLERAGRPVPIRAKTFALRCYLARNPGRVIGKDELVQAVWGAIAITDDALTHVQRYKPHKGFSGIKTSMAGGHVDMFMLLPCSHLRISSCATAVRSTLFHSAKLVHIRIPASLSVLAKEKRRDGDLGEGGRRQARAAGQQPPLLSRRYAAAGRRLAQPYPAAYAQQEAVRLWNISRNCSVDFGKSVPLSQSRITA